MKKKVILSSILSIVLCLSLIAGSTLALFTSESEVNIAVTAGKVSLTAGVNGIETWSLEDDKDGAGRTDGSFTMGGSAEFENGVLNLVNIIPGDKVSFNITGKNDSNVKVLYRYIIECTKGYMLMSGLDVNVNGTKYENLASYTSAWTELKVGTSFEVPVTIELPEEAGNEYQEETTSIRVIVEAVQGNADKSTDTEEVVTIDKVQNDAAALAAALTANEKDIYVVLADDIDLPITSLGTITLSSGEYMLGGADTETITIDLNGHKLNLTTGYWSAIGAQNPDATITIKDGSMNSTGNSANTWDGFDLRFCNCNWVFENVVFDKAVALDNAGKATTMTDVTINETHDYYALWITAEGQTVDIDGLTVNSDGRGIKIDEQYVNTPAKVTLNVSNATFTTAKKAAIVVKSAAGADIALDNVDIANVAADSTNAVWVDANAAATYDLVTVTGGTKVLESSLVANDNALNAAIANGDTTITLAGGTYIIPDSAQGKTLTIIGVGETVIATQDDGSYEGCDYSLDGSNVTFKNITINTTSKTYTGYARLNATYENCTINGTYTLYGNSTFRDCTFNVSGDVYNIWTWGAPKATFENCTFNSDGKALLLYGQANTKLTVNNCTFNDNGGLTDLKAAIEIGNDYNKSYELIVNNTNVNGYEINDKGISTGTNLWANKNSMSKDNLNVVVDGVDVY